MFQKLNNENFKKSLKKGEKMEIDDTFKLEILLEKIEEKKKWLKTMVDRGDDFITQRLCSYSYEIIDEILESYNNKLTFLQKR